MTDLEQARAYLDMNQPQRAVDRARNAVARDPDHVGARVVLVCALVRADRGPEAVGAGREALRIAPDDPELLFWFAVAEYGCGNNMPAIQALRRAVEVCPDDARIHAMLGRALARHGFATQAIAEASRAVELDPAADDPYQALGDVHSQLGNWREAESAYRQALSIDPENVATHINLGYVLDRRRRRGTALQHSLTAARLDPTDRVATANVLGLSRNALAGSGLLLGVVLYVALLVAAAGAEIPAALLVISAVAGIVLRRRRRRERLPPAARAAVRSSMRREGPGRLSSWLTLAYVGQQVLALSLVERLVRTPTGAGWLVGAGIGAGLLLPAVWMARRKWPHRDPREHLRGSASTWAGVTIVLALLLLLPLATSLDALLVADLAGALESFLGVVLLAPLALGAAYAWFVKAGRSSRALSR